MRAAIYARVSTADKDQNPDTQLLPLREFCQAQGWTVAGEFVDTASATDLRGRVAWRDLLSQASKRKLDLILVWKLDRAFRSVAHCSTTLQDLKHWGIGVRSYTEPWLDTSGQSPAADLMLNILVSFSQFEKALIAERVRAGMARAKREGKAVGRPRLVLKGWGTVYSRLQEGKLSQRGAARILRVSAATVNRLVAAGRADAQYPRQFQPIRESPDR